MRKTKTFADDVVDQLNIVVDVQDNQVCGPFVGRLILLGTKQSDDRVIFASHNNLTREAADTEARRQLLYIHEVARLAARRYERVRRMRKMVEVSACDLDTILDLCEGEWSRLPAETASQRIARSEEKEAWDRLRAAADKA